MLEAGAQACDSGPGHATTVQDRLTLDARSEQLLSRPKVFGQRLKRTHPLQTRLDA
jgi:hypothetical protein